MTLVNFAGADHVMLGTDYPFDMGEPNPVGLIAKLALDDEDRGLITGGNAVSLFGLS